MLRFLLHSAFNFLLHSRVTVAFWTLLLCANLSAYYAFVPSFCPSGYDFAIPSSRLHLSMQTLGVAFGLVGNYLPADFHRRALVCPSYIKKGTPKIECTFYGNWRVLVPFHLHQNPLQNKLAPNLHQRQIFCKRKTPKTIVVSGFFDNRRKAVIISWRTEEHDVLP